MKRRIVTGLVSAAAAVGLLFAGSGVANATGSTGCTSSSYFHQYTTYHGTICYTNPGDDNLHTSDFWTGAIDTGNNSGYFNYYDQSGVYWTQPFVAHQYYPYNTTVALDFLHID